MSARLRRLIVLAPIVSAAVALAACASVSDDAQDSSLKALATREPEKAPGPAGPAANKRCPSRWFRSLEPSALPRPGHMPANTFARDIYDRGRLTVGVDQNSLGLGYFNPVNERLEGFDISVVREIARAIFGDTKPIRYIAISTQQRQSAVVDKDVDLVASAYSITCERLRHMRFTSVYYEAQQRLLVPEDSNDDSLSDLAGERVCATKGSTSIARLEGTGVVPRPVELRSDCLVLLQEGKVSAVTSDDAILFGFCQQDPQTKIVGRSLNVERYGIAIHKQRPGFVRFVNAVLKRLRRGRLQALRERWLGGLTEATDAEIARCPRPRSQG